MDLNKVIQTATAEYICSDGFQNVVKESVKKMIDDKINDTVRMNANYPSLDYYVNSGQPNTAAEVGELDVLKDNGYTASNLKIGALYIYNKILTAQEVADNYNNTKTRFGL